MGRGAKKLRMLRVHLCSEISWFRCALPLALCVLRAHLYPEFSWFRCGPPPWLLNRVWDRRRAPPPPFFNTQNHLRKWAILQNWYNRGGGRGDQKSLFILRHPIHLANKDFCKIDPIGGGLGGPKILVCNFTIYFKRRHLIHLHKWGFCKIDTKEGGQAGPKFLFAILPSILYLDTQWGGAGGTKNPCLQFYHLF